ncbi:MAG: hypothetical protein QW097_02600 [archaeon]
MDNKAQVSLDYLMSLALTLVIAIVLLALILQIFGLKDTVVGLLDAIKIKVLS